MKYWENERPLTVKTNKNILQFYPEAGQLSVARSPWEDSNGVERQGKTVTLNLSALCESGMEALSGARDVFAAIVQMIDERIGLIG